MFTCTKLTCALVQNWERNAGPGVFPFLLLHVSSWYVQCSLGCPKSLAKLSNWQKNQQQQNKTPLLRNRYGWTGAAWYLFEISQEMGEAKGVGSHSTYGAFVWG